MRCPRCGRDARKRDAGVCTIGRYEAILPEAYICKGDGNIGDCWTIFDQYGRMFVATIRGAYSPGGFVLPLIEEIWG